MSTSPQQLANAIRALSMDAVQAANSGHPGMPMGMADVATILFTKHLKFNPKAPKWQDRDRFVLSAGHGSMLLYSLLYLTGYEDISLENIKQFRQMHQPTAGHPEYGELAGIETTTGPLGQGIATAGGMALAEAMLDARFGKELVDHYTYVIAGDGCLMEGICQEAISLAGHLQLGKLIVLFDDNGISIDGSTDLTTSEDHIKRFEACGWDTQSIDGHDMEAIDAAIAKAKASNTPSLIACKTTIAYGAPTKAGTSASHGAPLGEEEIAGTKAALGWEHGPFEIPADILSAWREAGQRSQTDYDAWQQRYQASAQKEAFDQIHATGIDAATEAAIDAYKRDLAKTQPKEATRKSSGNALAVITPAMPALIGGSADLTGSNLTKTPELTPVQKNDFSGRYVYYGVREHAMCAFMNGMQLHGGIRPYGGTFFVFTDYCKPAIRLAALMQQPVVFVMTHDSIGLGEDGPTHQPIEHLAALRAMPNVHVLRPADATETLECWEIALKTSTTPSVLVLSRQGVPSVRSSYDAENKCAKGAYLLRESDNATVTLIATGTELELALQAAEELHEKGIAADVVSMPSMELFNAESAAYQDKVLKPHTHKIAIEAGAQLGWERYIGRDGSFIGMQSFGASAPAPELYAHFGITVDAIINAATTANAAQQEQTRKAS